MFPRQADVLWYTAKQANSYLICYLCEIYKTTASMFSQTLLKYNAKWKSNFIWTEIIVQNDEVRCKKMSFSTLIFCSKVPSKCRKCRFAPGPPTPPKKENLSFQNCDIIFDWHRKIHRSAPALHTITIEKNIVRLLNAC